MIVMVDDKGEPIVMDQDAQSLLSILCSTINTVTYLMVREQRTENWINTVAVKLAVLLSDDPHALCPVAEIIGKAQEAVWGGEVQARDGKITIHPPGPDEICEGDDGPPPDNGDDSDDDPDMEGIFSDL